MKIDSSDFIPRQGKAVDLDEWPTLLPPLFESKAENEAVLKQHVETPLELHQLVVVYPGSVRYALRPDVEVMSLAQCLAEMA